MFRTKRKLTFTTRRIRAVTLGSGARQLSTVALRFGGNNSTTSGQGLPQSPRSSSLGLLLAAGLSSLATGSLVYSYSKRDAPSAISHVSKPVYASREEMEKAIKDIQRKLGEDSISTDDEDLKIHGYSEWSSINIDRLPVAVAYPKSTEEVAEIAKTCHIYKVPMIPYSGGSSVEGHFSAPFGGVSFDFMYMSKVVAFHPEDMDIVVQPSVSWVDMNESIKESGLFFPIDPGPPAKIGGMIAMNCSGTNAVRYGTMKDWVVNLAVVLSDGRIIKTRKRPRKSSAGYNLNGIFTGSEGTLGFVTEVTLKLAAIPEETGVAVIYAGIPVGAVEILDDVQMDVRNEGKVQDNIAGVRKIVRQNGGSDFEVEQDKAKQHALWSARKEALFSMLCLRESGDELWSTDVAVPLSKVHDLVEVSKQDLNKLGLFGSMLGHIGDGNFHEAILFEGDKERERVRKYVHNMVHRALEMEGISTGERGIGLGKKEFLVEEVGEGSLPVMKTIKAALDPHWLMNPGKIFDA
ncbi:putative D-lactate protein [Aspergillus pseudoustus]|uniref:D-lactate dehydrogenase (cytochrome) n=1 Tax=Aspergillus pseudoustus TaxID=1810923 RepID=A0ABR4KIT4_9EURO